MVFIISTDRRVLGLNYADDRREVVCDLWSYGVSLVVYRDLRFIYRGPRYVDLFSDFGGACTGVADDCVYMQFLMAVDDDEVDRTGCVFASFGYDLAQGDVSAIIDVCRIAVFVAIDSIYFHAEGYVYAHRVVVDGEG